MKLHLDTYFLLVIGSLWATIDSAQILSSSSYAPAAALFGPTNKFVCNAVVLAKGRVLTAANCLAVMKNESYRIGVPQDFHIALETGSIEMIEKGDAFIESARDRFLRKLTRNSPEKYDNKVSNDIFSDQLDHDESEYLLKNIRAHELGPKLSNIYVSVNNLTLHSNFSGMFINAVAVLEIPSSRPFSSSAVPKEFNLSVFEEHDQPVQVHGWGVVSNGSDYQQEMTSYGVRTIDMRIAPLSSCEQEFGSLFIPEQHICLLPRANETVCSGFTGAPIVQEGKLIGIVLFGDYRCSLQTPVVGARLGAFSEFLKLEPQSIITTIATAIRSAFQMVTSMFSS